MSDTFDAGEELKFPVITIHISDDELNEPVHVDLGSVPPYIAAAVLEKVVKALQDMSPGPRISFKGKVVAEPLLSAEVSLEKFLEGFYDPDDDDDSWDDGRPA